MNQLNGKYVNVVLSVEDGRGMEFVKHPIHVAANFNTRILESDRITPEDRATFNTELIWEIEKKDLRKVRSSNLPLRVECICTDPQNRKDRIGFVLLSLRSGQIIPLKDAKDPVSFKWYKLIGCQADKKKHHPELYLALTIRDHLLKEHDEHIPQNMPLISEEEQNIDKTSFSTDFPLRYLDDGYIQIGSDDACESFSLNILVKEAKNLDILLPEAMVFQQNQEKYHMTFNIFGVTIKTKPFYKQFYDVISLNEKVVVRMLSSEQTLFDFFSTQTIGITLFNGHEKLGSTDVDLGKITFEEDSIRCFFKLSSPNDMVPFGGDDTSPFIEIHTWLKRSSDYRFKLNIEEKSPAKVVFSNLDKPVVSAGGEQTKICVLGKLEKVDVKAKSECSLANDTEDVVITKSADTMIKNVPLSPRVEKKYDVMGTYAKYVLEVTMQNFVWRLSPKDKIVIFKFLHPRASNYITIFTQINNVVGTSIDLKNIGVKISYVSNNFQIENILNAWPPKLVLTDEREKLISEEYEFDASKFFSDDYRSYKYLAELKAVRTLQPLARVQVTLKLEEGELGEIEGDTDFHLSPPIVDEVLSVKELADVEKWKKTQKDMFEKEMAKLKDQESKRLESIWKERKTKMEAKLCGQMEKCRKLQENLQMKINGFKTEKYLIKRRNQANIYEEIFKENWEKYSKSDVTNIVETLSKTQRDNEYLKKLVEDQRKKLEILEKTTLTKEQTSNLLQELSGLERQFEEAQDAKKYFKEQWKKACDEIHELKSEEYKQMQLQIKRSKEELSHLSLDGFSEYVTNKFALNDENMTNRSTKSAQNY